MTELLGPDGEEISGDNKEGKPKEDESIGKIEIGEDFPQNLVDFLNKVNEVDGFVGTRLINLKFSANEELAKETEVIVRQKQDGNGYRGSLLGIINGFLSHYDKVIKADAKVNPENGHVQEVYEFLLGDEK